MFATVSGALPRPPIAADDEDELVRRAIAAQEEAGLDALTDGRLRANDLFRDLSAWVDPNGWSVGRTVPGWQFAARCGPRPVKQTLPGPYSVGRRVETRSDAGFAARQSLTLELADALNLEARALASAGCPLVEIEETHASAIGDDERERSLFREAHRRLTEGVEGVHLSLALVGRSAGAAGAATIFDAPYASHLFDLIAGPDAWRLVVAAPPERGIVCGALRATPNADGSPELLVWAAHYAASTGGRGLDRVGLANAAGLDALPWEVVLRKLGRLGEAARLAALAPSGELAQGLDPRAIGRRPRSRA